MSKKSKVERDNSDKECLGLPVSPEYAEKFTKLPAGVTVTLEDAKSKANAKLSIRATEGEVYYARPEGEIIPEITGQKKIDYVIFCAGTKWQVNFVEMKGQNILLGCKDSPFNQILNTIAYFNKTEGLKELVSQQVEKHAFIVSALKHRVPSGVEKAERTLLKQLALGNPRGYKADEYLHYVRYIPNAKYSDKDRHIICSSDEPLEIPYEKRNRS